MYIYKYMYMIGAHLCTLTVHVLCTSTLENKKDSPSPRLGFPLDKVRYLT